MKQKTISGKIVALLLAVLMILSLAQPAIGGTMVLAAELPAVGKNLSISGDKGYFMKDNKLHEYTLSTGEIKEVSVKETFTDAQFVTYDGSRVYIADAKSVIYAYSTDDFTAPLWVYDGLKDETVKDWYDNTSYYEVGAEMVVLNDVLYAYSVTTDGSQSYTYVIGLNTADGKEKTKEGPVSQYGKKDVEVGTAVVIDDTVLFLGMSGAMIDTGDNTVKMFRNSFESGFVYDAKLNKLMGIMDDYNASGAALINYPLELDSYNMTPIATQFSWKAGGSNPVFAAKDGVPLIFSVKDGKVIYEVFSGLDLVEVETGITAEQVIAVTVSGNKAYILDNQGTVHETELLDLSTVETGLTPSEAAQKLDAEISEKIGWSVNLTMKEDIDALYDRYTDMSDADKRGVLKAQKLLDAHGDLIAQQQAVDAVNETVKALPTPEELTIADREAVKAAETARGDLSPAANQAFVDEKLDKLLQKTAAYDVMDVIDALPDPEDVTIADNVAVQNAAKQYEAVADIWKGEVTNIERLEQVKEALNELFNDMEMGTESYWSTMGKDQTNSTVVESKTPIDMEKTEIILGKEGEDPISVGDPVIVGDRMYFAYKNMLYCYDLEGNKLMETEMYSSIGFFSRITYGDGKIYVPLSSRIQAFDAKTLAPLWVSKTTNNQLISSVTYHDGYVYSGYTSGGGGNTDPTNGAFFCISTKDEDPSKGYEEKEFVWTSQTGGYYWAGAVVVGNKIYFAGDAGVLYAHHLTEDIVYDSYSVGGQVRANLLYDKQTNRILLGTKDNPHAYSIELNEDGTFNRDTVAVTEDGAVGGLTGGLSVYNGRVYSASGGMHAFGGFTVVDAETLEPIYAHENISTQSIPLITKAYASADNQVVYVYVVDMMSGVGYILEDKPGQTEPIVKDTIEGGTLYNSSSMKADQYGNLYFIGGSNRPAYKLTIYRNTDAAFTAEDVENAVSLLPEVSEVTYADKAEVQQAYKRYEEYKKEKAGELSSVVAEKIEGLKAKIDTLTAEMLAAADEAISLIPDEVTADDALLVEAAEKLYTPLLEADRMKLAGREKLLSSLYILAEQMNSVPGLIEEIDKLPDVITLEHQAKVTELWSRYEKLPEATKEEVTNRDKLISAKQTIDRLLDAKTAEELIPQIDKLPQPDALTLHDEKTVNDLYEVYAALGEEGKALVTNSDVLLKAYETVSALRATVDGISNDIWNKINPENITLADKAVVEDLMKRYNALRPVDQEFVKYYDDVLYAWDVIQELEQENGTSDGNNNTAGGDNTDSDSNLPNTGDHTGSWPVLIMLLSGFGLVMMVYSKRLKR